MSNVAMMMGLSSSAGGGVDVADVFSTYLYAGSSPSTQTITNGIDLDGEGGLVWLKSRTEAQGHSLFDTERGANELLQSEASTASQTVSNRGVTAFNSNGFDLGGSTAGNRVSNDYASWTFRKAPQFFDVVTYTGNGVNGREIAHNLGSTPGMIIIKNLDNNNRWYAWHNSFANNEYLYLNESYAKNNFGLVSYLTADPTSTTITINNDTTVNSSAGYNYVAYVFAHNEDLIQCGSFVQGTSSYDVDLGFEPQWVLIKSATSVTNWYLFDSMRGLVTGGNDAVLLANGSAAEANSDPYLSLSPNGFTSHLDQITGNQTYIYMAIKAED